MLGQPGREPQMQIVEGLAPGCHRSTPRAGAIALAQKQLWGPHGTPCSVQHSYASTTRASYDSGAAMPDEDPDNSEKSEDSAHSFDAVEAAAEFAAAMAKDPPRAPNGDAPGPGHDRYTALLEDEVESLKAELAEKEEALAAAQKKAASAAAEVDRIRARLEASAAGTIEHKRRSVLASFLDVADALDRAVVELGNGGGAAAIAQGVQGVRSELQNVLRQHGAKHQPSMGHPFDPAHHEAIATVPATADSPAGTITAVLSEGYVLGDHTLRAARVVVAKG